jgi:hypothetical protein
MPYHTLIVIVQNLKKPKGVIALSKTCVVSYSSRKNFCLSVKTEAREYLIQGKSQAEIDEWKQTIENCINPYGQHILTPLFVITNGTLIVHLWHLFNHHCTRKKKNQ